MWTVTANVLVTTAAIWAVTSSVWVIKDTMGYVTGAVWTIAASVHAAQVLCGLLQPMCAIMWVLWGAIVASEWCMQALYGLSYTL